MTHNWSQHKRWSMRWCLAMLMVGTLGLCSLQAAFESKQKFTLTAELTTGGTPGGSTDLLLKIIHENLLGVSPVTRIALVQGSAGSQPEGVVPVFPSNFVSIDPQELGISIVIDVTLRFRTALPGADISAEPVQVIGPVRRPDPTAFDFLIPPDQLIEGGVIQYQIFVQKVDVAAGSDNVLLERYHPDFANTSPDKDCDSCWVEIGVQAPADDQILPSGGSVIMNDGNPNDGQARVDVPAGLLGDSASFSIVELPTDSPIVPPLGPGFDGPFSVFDVRSNVPVNGTYRLTLLYQDFVNPFGHNGTLGKDGIIDGTSIKATDATIVYFDGIRWRQAGGRVDTDSNTISVFTNKLSLFAIVQASPLAPKDRRPQKKIFTPNGDGQNETVEFNFNGVGNVTVDIYDINNHRIRTLSGSGVVEWNGRDSSGKLVESGVYIYQYTVEGQRISGIIGVAK